MQIKGHSANLNHPATETRQKLLEAGAVPRTSSHAAGKSAVKQGLSSAEQAQVNSLKARDAQVKQHERAHLAASGGISVSSASFTYARGADGHNYAVGGEVRIDTSPASSPEATLAKAEHIIDAALAPSDPSSIDRVVAAKAQQMAQQARAEIQQKQAEEARQNTPRKHVQDTYAQKENSKPDIDTFA